jgi:hypothetical protein
MEAYESQCPDCGRSYTWIGHKTGIGKTEVQLAQMKKARTTCKHCGSTNLKTGLDHTSEDGQAADAACGMVVQALFGSLPEKETKSEGKPMKFRKKPVVIEAVQFPGLNGDNPCFDPVIKVFPEAAKWKGWLHDDGTWRLDIPTLEGVVTASPGDWIIKGVAGEFYPCKPDIFEQTYEEVKC